jgi:hypothetical protein
MVTPTMFPVDKKASSTKKSLGQQCTNSFLAHKLSHDRWLWFFLGTRRCDLVVPADWGGVVTSILTNHHFCTFKILHRNQYIFIHNCWTWWTFGSKNRPLTSQSPNVALPLPPPSVFADHPSKIIEPSANPPPGAETIPLLYLWC